MCVEIPRRRSKLCGFKRFRWKKYRRTQATGVGAGAPLEIGHASWRKDTTSWRYSCERRESSNSSKRTRSLRRHALLAPCERRESSNSSKRSGSWGNNAAAAPCERRESSNSSKRPEVSLDLVLIPPCERRESSNSSKGAAVGLRDEREIGLREAREFEFVEGRENLSLAPVSGACERRESSNSSKDRSTPRQEIIAAVLREAREFEFVEGTKGAPGSCVPSFLREAREFEFVERSSGRMPRWCCAGSLARGERVRIRRRLPAGSRPPSMRGPPCERRESSNSSKAGPVAQECTITVLLARGARVRIRRRARIKARRGASRLLTLREAREFEFVEGWRRPAAPERERTLREAREFEFVEGAKSATAFFSGRRLREAREFEFVEGTRRGGSRRARGRACERRESSNSSKCPSPVPRQGYVIHPQEVERLEFVEASRSRGACSPLRALQ